MNMIFRTTSKEQGQTREGMSEESSLANPRTDEQKLRRRPRVWMNQPSMMKSAKERLRVNAAVAGRRLTFLPREISTTSGLETAPDVVTRMVIVEKSAEGIVARWHS